MTGHSTNRQLGAALKRAAQRAGEQTPAVRGADWRLATVTALPGGGLVEVDGVLEVRRLASYAAPAVGQVIVISQSSSGNWLALGPLAT
ncbi:hypothetical protein ABZX82_02195 [Streptomyces griseoflavus]|uniref:hypothetical protein n=1 Tax=Streptomyces griseoflavus TaxID=35619 RepID=UPI0033A09246